MTFLSTSRMIELGVDIFVALIITRLTIARERFSNQPGAVTSKPHFQLFFNLNLHSHLLMDWKTFLHSIGTYIFFCLVQIAIIKFSFLASLLVMFCLNAVSSCIIIQYIGEERFPEYSMTLVLWPGQRYQPVLGTIRIIFDITVLVLLLIELKFSEFCTIAHDTRIFDAFRCNDPTSLNCICASKSFDLRYGPYSTGQTLPGKQQSSSLCYCSSLTKDQFSIDYTIICELVFQLTMKD